MICPGKTNGRHYTERVRSGGGGRDTFVTLMRQRYGIARRIITGPVVLRWAVLYAKQGRADSSGALCFIEDCIQECLKYGYPLIQNDSQLVGFLPFDEYAPLNRITNSPLGNLIMFRLEPIDIARRV